MPTAVQLEVTYRCNNSCGFCYNSFGGLKVDEASTGEMQQTLKQLSSAGVFSVNFNGGEPLLREDIFDIFHYGAALGLDLHLNTNCTLVGSTEARIIARYFDAICTTVFSFDSDIHDNLCGRSGALNEVIRAIELLQARGVYIAVNITLGKSNASTIVETMRYLRLLGVQTVLITHITTPSSHRFCDENLSHEGIEKALFDILEFQSGKDKFLRLAFPEPYPPCRFSPSIRTSLKHYNIPCTAGLNTARITPSGEVTPCALLIEPCLGNVTKSSFYDIWRRFDGHAFFASRLPTTGCSSCAVLEECGGGCVALT